MEDRELLKLAAKAAGIGPVLCYESTRNCLRIGNRNSYRLWRPLEDDADALRLALELEMPIHPCRVWKHYRVDICSDFVEASRSVMPPSDAAATRRAIVEVAAEIGKAMQEQH